MSTTVKTGWLEDNNGEYFAPKTLTSQVQTNDGMLLEDKLAEIYETKIDASNKLASVEESLDAKTIKGTKITNSDVAYVKAVPENSAGYAKIGKIGGKTRKCTNLLVHPYYQSSQTINGITFTVNADGSINVNGTAEDTFAFFIHNYTSLTLKPASSYYIYGAPSECTEGTCYLNFYNVTTSTAYIDTGNGCSFEFAEGDDWNIAIVVFAGTTVSNLIFKPMLNEGTEALPYEPYFDGLRSAPVTEVESVGANLFNVTEEILNAASITGVKNIVINDANSLTGTPTNGSGVDFIFFPQRFTPGIYTIGGESTSLRRVMLRLYDSSGNNISSSYTLPSMTYNSIYSGFYADVDEMTIEIPAEVAFWGIGAYFHKSSTGTIVTLSKIKVCHGVGVPYKPYVRQALPIPEAVRNLDGYGWGVNESCYNYIDFEKKQYVKNVGKVDLGSITWLQYNDTITTFYRSEAIRGNVYKPNKNSQVVNLLCSKYKTVASNVASTLDKQIAISGNGDIVISDYSFVNNVEGLKNSLNGVMLYYELKTPEVIDISHLLPSDSIPVEAGGTIIMDNAYGYDVPNTVEFYEGANEIVGADTFVGDLIGTASRAIADENGNKIDVTAYAPAGYGLGQENTYIIANANTALKDGRYGVNDSTAQIPVAADGTMVVVSRDGNNKHQTIYYSDENRTICHRDVVGGYFKAWEYENPPMQVGVEYRTTERWEGKPVYTKLIKFGALPKNSEKSATFYMDSNYTIVSIDGVVRGEGLDEYGMVEEFDIHACPYVKEVASLQLNNKITIKTNGDATKYNAKIVLKYTR